MPSVSRRYPTGRSPFERPSGAVDDELRAPVVLMVSGGADSTALLVLAATSALDIDDGRGCARIARERLHVLHINHQLRGLDADEWAAAALRLLREDPAARAERATAGRAHAASFTWERCALETLAVYRSLR